MRLGQKKQFPGLKTSPWLILGAALILLIVVVALAVQNARRNRIYMAQVLKTKGAALIRAVEAGARTGMMGMRWGGGQVQRLIEETALIADVLYMAVIDENGVVLAHSDASLIGGPLDAGRKIKYLGPDNEEQVAVVTRDDGSRVFEVRRPFRPLPEGWRRHGRGMGKTMGRDPVHQGAVLDWSDPQHHHVQIIIAGLDVGPIEQTVVSDLRQSIILSIVLLLLGFAGFVSLFWMQSYRSAKRSLQDTSAFADQVVANLPVGLVATDQKGKIAFFNGAAGKLFGVEPEKALGLSSDEVLPPRLCGLESQLEQGTTIAEKEMVCNRDERYPQPVSVSAARITSEDGRLVGHVLILRDLGEVRRLQNEIRRQEKLAALGALAAGVAHEIRNPLSSIKGLATYFADKFDSGSEERSLAQVMTQEVDRLNRVISELLEFARPSELTKQASDVNQLIRHTLQLVQRDAAAGRIIVDQQLSDAICPVIIDADRLAQCLLNLFINAIQAMAAGGRLSVASAMAPGGLLSIAIGDTGCGIADDALEKIFDPYYTTKARGTGLGLAIVHKIIEAHGGRIGVESAPGRGARFTITLPCGTDIKGEQHAATAASEDPAGSGCG